MRILLSAFALFAAAIVVAQPKASISDAAITDEVNPPTLSTFGFFHGGSDRPSPKLIAYSLRTPLFSDYAEKQRFIYIPSEERVTIDADGTMQFPVGSALIKSFGYHDKVGTLRVIETRLLLHRNDGWVALPYVWRADGSDADLRVGGTRVPVTFTKPDGNALTISYSVPNKNQCKQCHQSSDAIVPIGPKFQNMIFASWGPFESMMQQAIIHADLRKLLSAPETIWDDAKSGTLDQRAQAYLRVNCGHCHAPKGSASNSGLFLDGSAKGLAAYGIGKRPVAAGRASGNFDFIIEAGRPDRSILVSRMKSIDPGIAMPELGRATVHDEGTKLLEEWIASMPLAASH
jgi:uncharacterized repeat protein (TIGR03806 family)